MIKTENFGTVKEPFPIAVTRYGKVVGETTDGVAVFRGIPYGGRCDRELRFLPAKEPESWDGVKDCTKNGPICVQTAGSVSDFYSTGGHPEKLKLRYETQDENCLCLNVLTPGLDAKKRPVMVYIHGGGFSILSGTIMTGADKLAREQDMVLVSMNHRLHVFGYLYLGQLDERYKDSGNVGQLDLILALKWVRDNIEYFGGDPDCVTIIGESGGSDKVLTLTHMPEAKGLFHRAVAISCFLPVGRITPDVATAYTEEALHVLGVSPKHLEKLLELPARYITEKIYHPDTHFWSQTFAPVSDGIHLGKGIGKGFVPAFDNGNVPLILGCSEDEMASFSLADGLDITEENIRAKMLERGKKYDLNFTEENVDTVLNAFRATNFKADPADHLFMKMISIRCHMGCAQYPAEDYATHKKETPIYLYLNRYDIPNGAHPYRRFAGHCTELSPFFRMVAYPEMEEYSKTVANLFASFMRTGKPECPGLNWPVFNMQQKPVMIFDRKFSVISDPLKTEQAALDTVTGEKAITNAFLHHEYKFPLAFKPEES
ncbi:MAG: carboxylesterase/lipase family protein [Hydrogeniiclostridium sp.]